MNRTLIASGVAALVAIGIAIAGAFAFIVRPALLSPPPGAAPDRAVTPSPDSATSPSPHAHSGFIYGRVTVDGGSYTGRIRWGGDQEAFWGDFFNGARKENVWAAHAPRQESGEGRHEIEIFGIKIGQGRSPLQRQFLAPFGDIARIEVHFSTVLMTLKSGARVELDRFEAGDIDDGVRIWDVARGTVDVDTRQIRLVEFLPTPPLADAPARIYGRVRTRQGLFEGFVHWDQYDGAGSDTLEGRGDAGEVHLRYDTIRSITRRSRDSALVTLRDGRTLLLSGTRDVGRDSRGLYVDDPRYGRALISWGTFEHVDLDTAHEGPPYDDFLPGRRLQGGVTTRDGRRLSGRLVFDFDESETTDTLDVSFQGIDYAIPFGRVVSIEPAGRGNGESVPASVTLSGGETLSLERSGDLGEQNAGLLVFADGAEHPDFVAWDDVARIDLDPLVAATAAGGASPGSGR